MTLNLGEVVVPLDGSAFARRAIGPAVSVGGRLDVPVTLVTVVPSGEVPDENLRGGQAGEQPLRVLVGDDAGMAIGSYVEETGSAVVCMTTHGHGWPTSALVGSAASIFLARSEGPLLAVGPGCLDGWTLGSRLVLCVDGQPASESALPGAAAWAAALGVELVIVTVAEPVPPRLEPVEGPRGDLESYVAGLADSANASGHVIWDPTGVLPGLQSWLGDAPTELLAISGHGRGPRADIPLGHTALRIIRESPVPVLVFPSPPAD